MDYVITAREANSRGFWKQICELFGVNEWAMNEGLMDSSHEFRLTEKEAIKIGLIKRD